MLLWQISVYKYTQDIIPQVMYRISKTQYVENFRSASQNNLMLCVCVQRIWQQALIAADITRQVVIRGVGN